MNAKDVLKEYWGYPGFRGSQAHIIEAVVGGKDVLALLPTGGGKSVCYQIPSLMQQGLCIVVSPLIALIQDQVASLKKKGIKAIALTGGISTDEVIDLLDNCLYGNYKFLYLSPERLQQPMVQERISQMHVNLLAIDEAHCISQWGNDFRPAYLQCAVLRELQPGVPMIALTATATREVAQEIAANLHLNAPLTFKDSFERKNIAYKVVREEDRLYRLKQSCSENSGGGIVYVRTRRMAEELSAFLNKEGMIAAFYHGGLSGKEKATRLKQWQASKIQFMVATNAFGMGVDKADVRQVIHYQIPDSLEHYFQEAGRAGRDGLPAEALLLSSPADEMQLPKQFLNTLPDTVFLKQLYKTLNNYFQIPYGTGENQTFNFRFNQFCDTYKLQTMLAYNGLQLLDQHSVIALSQNFKRKTEVRFIASKGPLWTYLERHPPLAPLVQMILRTYGGIFDFETKINTLLIAKKAGVSETEVISLLEQLHKDELIDYKAREGDLEITFLVPREDERTINRFAHLVRKHQQRRLDQLKKMLRYVSDRQHCRTRQILHYFGEQLEKDCGQCDICLERDPIAADVTQQIGGEIMSLLKTGNHNSRAIIRVLKRDEKPVLKTLQLLLEAGRIRIGDKNEYILVQ